ncbi:MAG TPA: ABC transporter substrate-binding protein [Bosea sp. (in: a-proteobacteria)]|uniref:ABC transporter substrate-binding protein n=1 Tax=Bosea sp. (in: a-proteobacteria) TaxID=1871050 RepID=UPI002E11E74A|nr:ABC transporter substrate-binding protein [Bosea sp. (in: a-proteobacteria)]
MLKNTAVAAALGAAMVISQPSSSLSQEKTLRVSMLYDLNLIDPYAQTGYLPRYLGFMAYDTLFSINSKGDIAPQVADSWSLSPDKLVHTIKIRSGLKFHDGSPVTAADVAASVKRALQRNRFVHFASLVTSVDVVDDQTFSFTLSREFKILDYLANIHTPTFIMPKADAETPITQSISKVNGSGPFIFRHDLWKPGSRAIFDKNPDYAPRSEAPDFMSGGKHVNVDRVEWVYIADKRTAVSALKKGEIDWIVSVQPEYIADLKKSEGVEVAVFDDSGFDAVLRMNMTQPPFDNVKIRQAVMATVDQEEYLGLAIGDPEYYKVCASYLVCRSPWAVEMPGTTLRKKDLPLARKLLKEGGYKGEKIVILDAQDIPSIHQYALITAQNLRSIGMNVEVRPTDQATLLTSRARRTPPTEGGWSIFHAASAGLTVDTIVKNHYLWMNPQRAFFGWPDNPEMEKLRIDFSFATDDKVAHEINRKFHELAWAYVPHIPIGNTFEASAYRTNIKGIIKSEVPTFWNLTKD